MTFKVGTKVVIVKDFDTAPYRACVGGLCDVERVGLSGVVGTSEPPAGKTSVSFFLGDLGYETYDTKEDANPDDFKEIYVPTEVLAAQD